MGNEDKNLNEDVRKLKHTTNSMKDSNRNELLEFFIGVILLGVGLFMFANQVRVHGSWYVWRIGSFDLTSGLVTVPLIIGIVWQFVNPKSIMAKIIMTLGAIFIIATVIMSIKITFVTTSLYVYILIVGLIAAGAGLVLRVLFKKKDDKNN